MNFYECDQGVEPIAIKKQICLVVRAELAPETSRLPLLSLLPLFSPLDNAASFCVTIRERLPKLLIALLLCYKQHDFNG